MAAPKFPFEVMLDAKAEPTPSEKRELRRLSRIGKPLTAVESVALECLKQIAREGRRAMQPEICAAVGVDNIQSGTVPAILERLEDKGFIRREFFQRGLKIHIPSIGLSTADPPNAAAHWRLRTEQIPAPAIQQIRERNKPLAAMIEADAKAEGRHLSDYLADLVYIGFHERQAEKERGE